MKFRTVRLGEVVRIEGGGTPSRDRADYFGGSIPWMTVKDFGDELRIRRTQESITASGLDNSASRLIPAGNVIVGTRMSVGRAVVNLVDLAINQDLKALMCDGTLHPEYLNFCLAFLRPKLSAQATGATVKGITIDDIQNLCIPLPSLPEQRRIAAVLEQADRLRRTRRYAIVLADTFVPAAFLEMFGDPMQNPKGWRVEMLSELGNLDRGRSKHRPRNAAFLYGGPYPFVQTGDVSNAQGYVRSHTQTYSEEGLKQSKLWPAGTLCITIAANIAETAILTYPSCFPDSIVGFSPGSGAEVEYVRFWLGFLRQHLEDTAPEVAQKNINLEILRELTCPIPPLPLQRRFADLVAGHERLRAMQREALRQAEHLFQTLLHDAFADGAA